MKHNMKRVILGTLISAIISSTSVSASVGTIQKDLWYNNIKITLDNQEITPTDANGTYVEPFIIDGTTYLPVRAVSDALGLSVNWDANTNTVKLSTKQSANIKTEELLSALQGNWLCEYDVDPSQNQYYYLILKFNGSTISSGYYASEAFPDETITGVTMIADNTFEVTTYTPAGEWFGEYYPEEYNTVTLSSTDGFQKELIVTQKSGYVFRYLFAGTTPQETDAFFNQIIGK